MTIDEKVEAARQYEEFRQDRVLQGDSRNNPDDWAELLREQATAAVLQEALDFADTVADGGQHEEYLSGRALRLKQMIKEVSP